jgi:tripartite-type tricarboxylate transporter receptor subunit TctC
MKTSSLISCAALGLSLSLSATAQTTPAAWPERPVRIVVPFAPGNTLDTAVRVVAEEFRKNTGQALLVEAKPGGGTSRARRLHAAAVQHQHAHHQSAHLQQAAL